MKKKKKLSAELVVNIDQWKQMPHAKLAAVTEALYQLTQSSDAGGPVTAAALRLKEKMQPDSSQAVEVQAAELAEMLSGGIDSDGRSTPMFDTGDVPGGKSEGKGTRRK